MSEVNSGYRYNPGDYLYVGKDKKVYTRKGGFITWIQSHVTAKQSYDLRNVIEKFGAQYEDVWKRSLHDALLSRFRERHKDLKKIKIFEDKIRGLLSNHGWSAESSSTKEDLKSDQPKIEVQPTKKTDTALRGLRMEIPSQKKLESIPSDARAKKNQLSLSDGLVASLDLEAEKLDQSKIGAESKKESETSLRVAQSVFLFKKEECEKRTQEILKKFYALKDRISPFEKLFPTIGPSLGKLAGEVKVIEEAHLETEHDFEIVTKKQKEIDDSIATLMEDIFKKRKDFVEKKIERLGIFFPCAKKVLEGAKDDEKSLGELERNVNLKWDEVQGRILRQKEEILKKVDDIERLWKKKNTMPLKEKTIMLDLICSIEKLELEETQSLMSENTGRTIAEVLGKISEIASQIRGFGAEFHVMSSESKFSLHDREDLFAQCMRFLCWREGVIKREQPDPGEQQTLTAVGSTVKESVPLPEQASVEKLPDAKYAAQRLSKVEEDTKVKPVVEISTKKLVAPAPVPVESFRVRTDDENSAALVNSAWFCSASAEDDGIVKKFLQSFEQNAVTGKISEEKFLEYFRCIAVINKKNSLGKKDIGMIVKGILCFPDLKKTEEFARVIGRFDEESQTIIQSQITYFEEHKRDLRFVSQEKNGQVLYDEICARMEDEAWELYESPWVGAPFDPEITFNAVYGYLRDVQQIPSPITEEYIEKVSTVLYVLMTSNSAAAFNASTGLLKTFINNLPTMYEKIICFSSSAKAVTRTFRRLYSFYLESDITVETVKNPGTRFWGDDIARKALDPTKPIGDPLEIFKRIRTTILGGDPTVISAIGEKKSIFLEKVPRMFSPIPKSDNAKWHASLFSDSFVDDKKWDEGTTQAGIYGKRILRAFQNIIPKIDMEYLLKAITTGIPPIENLLSRYKDGGVSLLKELLLPYCLYDLRSKTKKESRLRRFLGTAASPDAIAGLVGKDSAAIVRALVQAIKLTRREPPIVVQKDQLGMFVSMIKCIEKNTPVYISNDAGAGKTTCSMHAVAFASVDVPYVFHVAPFVQSEEGWISLQKVQFGSKMQTGPIHIACTPQELVAFLKGTSTDKKEILQKSFFILDEYDSDAYTGSSASVKPLQDVLLSDWQVRKIAFMSATPNLRTVANKIKRNESKCKRLQEMNVEQKLKEAKEALAQATKLSKGVDETRKLQRTVEEWEKLKEVLVKTKAKLEELKKVEEALRASMEQEWQRGITIAQLGESVLSRIESPDKSKSVLIEMPKSDTVEALSKQLKQKTDGTDSVVVYRDTTGKLVASVFEGQGWKNLDFATFEKEFESKYAKFSVYCLYAQDSIGGDFGMFSKTPFVSSQYVVYPDTIYPSYAIYQHLRRLRRDKLANVNSIPVHFLVGSGLANKSKDQFLSEAKQKTEVAYQKAEVARLLQRMDRIKKQKVEKFNELQLAFEKMEMKKVLEAQKEKFRSVVKDFSRKATENFKDAPTDDTIKKLETELGDDPVICVLLRKSIHVQKRINFDSKEDWVAALTTEFTQRVALYQKELDSVYQEQVQISAAEMKQRTGLSENVTEFVGKITQEKRSLKKTFSPSSFEEESLEEKFYAALRMTKLSETGLNSIFCGVKGELKVGDTCEKMFLLWMKKIITKPHSENFDQMCSDLLKLWFGKRQRVLNVKFEARDLEMGTNFLTFKMKGSLQNISTRMVQNIATEKKNFRIKEQAKVNLALALQEVRAKAIIRKDSIDQDSDIKKLEEKERYYSAMIKEETGGQGKK